jgi:uncharacterized membrane protein YbjE (DUF340 family)
MTGLLTGKLIRSYNLNKHVARFTLIGVMALLFTMGAQIGSNPDVLSNLPVLGAKAFVFALLCSLGSVLFSWPLILKKR